MRDAKRKICGACRRSYTGMGRRVVAGEEFRVACPTCAATAVRVVQSVVAPICVCGGAASRCEDCLRRALKEERESCLRSAVSTLEASLATVRQTSGSGERRKYVLGILDGMQRAIEALLRES
jgi:endogenous inhibitor of DNA gyrase (YacG/DUF329 family)